MGVSGIFCFAGIAAAIFFAGAMIARALQEVASAQRAHTVAMMGFLQHAKYAAEGLKRLSMSRPS